MDKADLRALRMRHPDDYHAYLTCLNELQWMSETAFCKGMTYARLHSYPVQRLVESPRQLYFQLTMCLWDRWVVKERELAETLEDHPIANVAILERIAYHLAC